MTDRRTIVAMGGGGFSLWPDNGRLDQFLIGLARKRAGHDRPRVCFIPTARADDPSKIADFYETYAGHAEPSVLRLFDREIVDIEGHLRAQDLVFVVGGNTANMLAIWRLHGVDRAMRAAWQDGVVMSGVSAGGICWFEACTTDSFGPELQPLRDGFGVLQGSFVPHYDGEGQRRPQFIRLVADGTLPGGYGVDDGAALVFHGTELTEVVTSRPDARAYRVERSGEKAVETPLPARTLNGGR